MVSTDPGEVLLSLLGRAVCDADVKRLLFDDPDRAAETYGLTARDRNRLRRVSRADFEAAVGRFVIHQLVPVKIGERLLVSPGLVHGMRRPDGPEIIIDQSKTGASIGAEGTSKNEGRVFGSGMHPTTRLCVRMLEKALLPGMRVLDLGAGSGILALAAARFGAGMVIGLDVDPQAVAAARDNAVRNGFEGVIQFHTGDATWLQSRAIAPFDLVVSNILADVHLENVKLGMLGFICQGGRVIVSGMQGAGAARVAAALQQEGFGSVKAVHMGAWYALTAVQSGRIVDGTAMA